VKRALVLVALAAVAAVAGALAYRSAARDRSYRLLVASGEAALAANQTLAAVEDFSGAIAVRPEAMLPHLRRGETYRRRGDLDPAARDFRTAAALDPTATRPLESLGDVLFEQSRFKRAIDSYEARLKLDDRSPQIRYKLALAYFRDGSEQQALAEAQRALSLDDRLADAHYLVALCLRGAGNTDGAIASLRLALDRSAGMIAAREELADLLGSARRDGEQLEQLQILAGLDSTHADRQVALAFAQVQTGNPEMAILTLTGAATQNPDQPRIAAALGRIWLDIAEQRPERTDALAGALEWLERGASSLSATSEIKGLYGRALALSGQLEAAEQVYRQAIERYPLDPPVLRELAGVAERLGHARIARNALVDYRALIQNDPDSAGDAARIGALSLTLSEPVAALPWLQRSVAQQPEDAGTLGLLAEAQLRLGHSEEARASLATALAMDPANRSLEALRARLGVVPR
jgi:tetratricopeptide (TPR) repeat protein